MTRKTIMMAAILGILCLIPLAGAPEKAIFIKNGTIVPVVGPVIPDGCLLIAGGRIARIGAGLIAPADAEIIDARGGFVYPGLISSLTTIGVIRHPGAGDDLNETGTSTAEVDPFDALNPEDDSVEVARIGGVTSVLTISGTRNVINGKSIVINLDGSLARDMVVRRDAAQIINVGARSEGRYPSTSPGVMSFLRDKFYQVQRYREAASRTAGKAGGDAFRRDLELDALIPVLAGETPAVFLTREELTVRNAIALIDEFHLKGILFARGGGGILKHADALAEKKIPVIWAGTADDPEEGQPYDINFRTAALLARAGVLFSIEKIVGQPDGRNSPRNLPVPAALSVAHGLSEEEAIKALTIRPAQILGVDKDMGSLEAGKIANVVVWSGSPLQMKSRVQAVIIGGRRIPLESRQTRLRDKFEKIVRERRGK